MENAHFESLYPADSRFEEIEKLITFIKGGNSCQIVSLPGVGRSNVFGFLSYNRNVRIKHLGENQKWFHFVTVNFSEIRKRPLIDATKLLFLTLVDSLRERNMLDAHQKAHEIFKESLSLNDELVLFQGFKRTIDLLAIEQELTIVFLFDRFEEYIPMLVSEFFTNLRVLRNRAKYRFSVVFSLNRPLEDIVEPTLFADFYEFLAGHTIYLPLLDKSTLTFRISYIEKATGKTLDKKQLDTILSLTAGQGKLTRIAVETLLASSDQQLASSKELEEFLLQQKPIQGGLYEIWQSLAPHEQNELKVNQESGIKNHGENLSYLYNVGLIKDNKIAIPLFEAFIKNLEQSVVPQSNSETIALDPQTNEIKKGSILLSDQLTATEFRLLKFFLQNPERILEREEIITSVWKDAKSTAGVTDQALDQLIFRLRHKIETDPNNPTHLQTVKGRGFRFTI